MSKEYIVEQQFSGEDFKGQALAADEYEGCSFDNCIFSKQDFSDKVFVDCSFYDCDFSMAILNKTAFKNVYFQGCKLIGLHFEDCNPFLLSMKFQDCQLDYSTFLNMNLKKMEYAESKLVEVDFTGADLSGLKLKKCDLEKVIFDDSNLEKADFRTAYNYTIDPEINNVKKANFSLNGVSGLLAKYDIIID